MNKIANHLELSVRAHNVLTRLEIETPEDFLQITEKEVLALTNAGRRTWQEIRDTQEHIKWSRAGGADWHQLQGLLRQVNFILQSRPAFRVALENGRLIPLTTRPEGDVR